MHAVKSDPAIRLSMRYIPGHIRLALLRRFLIAVCHIGSPDHHFVCQDLDESVYLNSVSSLGSQKSFAIIPCLLDLISMFKSGG